MPVAPEVSEEVLRGLVDRLSLEEKVRLLTGRDSWSLHPLPSIGLRSIVVSDGPAGVRGARWDERDPSTCFPSPTALSASWDPDGIEAVGRELGAETAEKGIDVLLAPTVNMQRTPFGGRHFETFSEDPRLAADIASAYVRGVQSGGVAATVKHYVANDSETDRFTVDVRVEDRTLRELYLVPFEETVREAGTWAIMSAYNSINGATASESPLLETPLRSEWGFDGVVVSDWTAVRSLDSARVPQDLVMPGPSGVWDAALVAAVRAGEIDESIVDRKVENILRLAVRVGALTPGVDTAVERTRPTPEESAPQREARRQVTRRASVEGTVLLANDGILPLGSPASIALIGEGFVLPRIQGGGSATVVPAEVSDPLASVRERWPQARVEHVLGAVVQTGLAPIDPDRLSTPDGRPGLRVSCLGAGDDLLHREDRATSTLVWFDGSTPAAGAEVIELAFTYRPPTPSTPTPGTPIAPTIALGVAGLSDVEVWADGEHVRSAELRTAPGADFSAVVLNPPWTSVDLPLAGPAVDVVVRFRPVSGEMPDALSLRIGVPPPPHPAEDLFAEAERAAAAAEVAVVMVGTSEDVESEGFDRTSLALPGAQDELVRRVVAANPRTVVVVNAGSPVLLPWSADAAAVLTTWFPGQEVGPALADVLSGDHEPGGRLPVTWPGPDDHDLLPTTTPEDGRLHYTEGLDIGHRRWLAAGRTPAFPFGHGLGYTTFDLGGAALGPDTGGTATGTAMQTRVVVPVRNTGERPGKCVVQVYASRVTDSDVPRPARWLVAHAVARLDAGEQRDVAVTVPHQRLAHHTDRGRVVEPGEWALEIGLSVTDLRGRLTLRT